MIALWVQGELDLALTLGQKEGTGRLEAGQFRLMSEGGDVW